MRPEAQSERPAPVFIYGLRDPRDGVIRYVGQTARPKERLSGHMAAQATLPMRVWVAELKAAGLRPEMVFLEEANDRATGRRVEKDWIQRHRDSLFNRAGISVAKIADDDPERIRLYERLREISPKAVSGSWYERHRAELLRGLALRRSESWNAFEERCDAAVARLRTAAKDAFAVRHVRYSGVYGLRMTAAPSERGVEQLAELERIVGQLEQLLARCHDQTGAN